MEVPNIVKEAVIRTIPKKNKCKKAKWLSEEALQIAEKREAKGKEEKERYTHLNAGFKKNSKDLTEAEEIKNTQKNYTKKIFMTQLTTMV